MRTLARYKLLFKPEHRAFTLIEVLVVIAILAVLLAALFPALRKAQELARRLVCSSHLRHIAVAWQLYTESHNGLFLKGRTANTGYGGWQGPLSEAGPRPLNPYVSEDLPEIIDSPGPANVFRCPGDNGSASSSAMKYFDEIGTSYMTNVFLIGDYSVWIGDEEVRRRINEYVKDARMQHISNPSEVLLLGDFHWWQQWVEDAPEGDVWHRRAGHFNMAFVDTHAALVEIEKGPAFGPGYRIWPFPELRELFPWPE